MEKKASIDLTPFESRQFFVFEGAYQQKMRPGRNKLLEYFEECFVLGNKISDERCREIYLKYAREKKGFWDPVWDKSKNRYNFQARDTLPAGQHWAYARVYRGYAPGMDTTGIYFQVACRWKEYGISDWTIVEASKIWLKHNIGALVQQGHLFIIPHGYVLKKMEELSG